MDSKGTGQGSPDAIRNMVMKARLNMPNSSGFTSLKRDTPRIASANEGGGDHRFTVVRS
jgi:hypothetical protein